MMTVVERWTPHMLLGHALSAGVIAAITLGLWEIVVTVLLGGDAFEPFRLVASLVFGLQAFLPGFPVWLAAPVGVVIHLGFAIIFAYVFLLVVAFFYQLSARTPLLLLYGILYGLALWEINVLTILLLVFPELAPRFSLANQVLNGIIAYSIFYGLVLGAYVAVFRPGVMANWKKPLNF